MALFGCISSRSAAAQTSSPDNTCCIRALSCSDRSTRIPQITTTIPETTRHRKQLERQFHIACVQLVSLNFALHEATTGSTIDYSPRSTRMQSRRYNPKTLMGLRGMYYKSVQEGADRLDLLATGFEEDSKVKSSRSRNISKPKPEHRPTTQSDSTKHKPAQQAPPRQPRMGTSGFKDFLSTPTQPKNTSTKDSFFDISVPTMTSRLPLHNQKYDANDSAYESSSIDSMTTSSASYDVSRADIWIKRSLSFEEDDEESIDSGFDSRNNSGRIYRRSTYV